MKNQISVFYHHSENQTKYFMILQFLVYTFITFDDGSFCMYHGIIVEFPGLKNVENQK